MKPSSKLVFFGNERLVSGLPRTDAPVLRALIAAGHDIVAVVSNYDAGTSRSNRTLEIAEVAAEHNISVLLPEKPGDIENELRAMHADAAILVAYGKIIPQRIIDVFGRVGIINIHPSLLPRHRGPTPIEQTILSGDTEAGISIIQLTAGMDEGAIYAQQSVPLSGHETKFELYEQLSSASTHLLLEVLPGILSGELVATPQQNTEVSYTTLISKQDGMLDPTTDNATMLERKVRAYLGYPKTRLRIKNNDVIITSSKVVRSLTDYPLVVPCAEDSYLTLLEVIAPSGKSMSGEAYMRGYMNE